MAINTAPVYRIVIPARNEGFRIPTKVPIPLGARATFEKIRADDLAVITEKDDPSRNFINGGTFTLNINLDNSDYNDPEIRSRIFSAIFSLNVACQEFPIVIDRGFLLRTARKTSLVKVFEEYGHTHQISGKFTISKDFDISALSELSDSTFLALSQHPPLKITLSRFNSSLGRRAFDEKIVDICIALESIFDAKSEIAFQFALYNSIISEQDANKRHAIFLLLKKLYTQRSNIVHGSQEINHEWATEKWDDIMRIAKTAIMQKIDYLSKHNHATWKPHLENLALGANIQN